MRAKNNIFEGRQKDLSQKQLKNEEKMFIGSLVGKDGETTRSIGEFYNIGKSTVSRYSSCYNGQFTPKKNGRPPKLDEISTSKIRQVLGGEKRIQMNDSEYRKLLDDEVINTADRAKSPAVPMSRQSIQYFEAKNKIQTDENPEETTEARERACSNYRKCFATACAYCDQEKRVVRELQLNFDGTQSTVGDKSSKKKAGKRIGGIKGDKSKKVRKTENKGITFYSLKSVPIMSSSGGFGPMVHIHADGKSLTLAFTLTFICAWLSLKPSHPPPFTANLIIIICL